ncbi:MAG: hypothetical protein ABIQ60_09835 [Burkholderiaceae bacterium]
MSSTRFDELLPFYVNGTLDEADSTWFDAYLREHPGAAAELAWARSLQSRLREDAPAVSSEIGMERALQRIRAQGPAADRERRSAPSARERLRGWVAAILPQPMLRPALAGALALVAVQSTVIVQMVGERADDASQLRSVAGSSPFDEGPFLKINFKGEARETEIRLLLVEVHGSLAAGPGQLGDYYVRVAPDKIAAASDKLRASTVVDAVAVVDGLPARR